MYQAFIFDQDGTIYLGDQILPGAVDLISRLREAGCRTFFLSNNPTKTREQYSSKLSAMGIVTPVEDVVNSSYVMVQWLLENCPFARLFVIGEDALKHELATAGFQLLESAAGVDIVIASFDRAFDYAKLQIAFDAIRAGARLVGTNPDRFCPTPSGGQPDCAAIIAAIEACTGVKCNPIVGKPSPIMVEMILSILDLTPEKCLVIGDRLETDIQMGIDAGMGTCLVLTGDATRETLALSGISPTFVVDNLGGLQAALFGANQ